MAKCKPSSAVVFFLIVAAFVLVFPLALADSNVTIQPGAEGNDTYIRRDLPNNNFETATELNLGLTGSGDMERVLFQFNLTFLPVGSTITHAEFRAYASFAQTEASTWAANISRVTADWAEAQATWNNRLSSDSWSSAGAENDNLIWASQNISSSSRWYNWTITSLVQSWVNGSYPNYGFVLIGQESTANDFKRLFSSDYTTDSSLRPMLILNWTDNAAPSITSIGDNSNATNPTSVNLTVNFSITWGDLDSSQANIWVCNSTNVMSNFTGGCAERAFCSTPNSSANPANCQYTAQNNDSSLVIYHVLVCDNEGNCSQLSSAQNFSVNHIPNLRLTFPNGGETINQSNGNYFINFTFNDTDNNTATADLYYSAVAGAKSNLIAADINLSSGNCTDPDSSSITTNNCTYPWNSTGILGVFFIDIAVNDTFNYSSDSSDSSFTVVSLIDTSPPNVTNSSISGNLTSGEVAVVRGNLTEQNIDRVWIEVTDPSGVKANHTMQVQSGDASTGIYNGTFEAGIVGSWAFQIFANDSLNNIGNSSVISFNVSKPNATPENERYQLTVLSNELLSISAKLNATDIVKGIYAFLNDSGYFTFISGYPQNKTVGNVTASSAASADWLVMSPSAQGTYNLSIRWSDRYSNTWNSSQINITVNNTAATSTSSSGNATVNLTIVKINAYPEVVSGSEYVSDILVKDQNGNFANASAVKITLFDSSGNLVAGPVDYTSQTATGRYKYNYTTPSTPQGIWETVVNVTRDGVFYFDSQYWKLVGGPFDVMNITIDDNVVPGLVISFIAENTGGVVQDLTATWNLTRTDTSETLDSGSDTFAVNAESTKSWTFYPTTNYEGAVKITIVGTYSSTEKASGFKTFSTTSSSGGGAGSSGGSSGGSGGGGGGGGGGGAGGTISAAKPAARGAKLDFLEIKKEINAIPYIPQSLSVVVKNSGNVTVNNLVLKLEGLPTAWYQVDPVIINSLEINQVEAFSVRIKVPQTEMSGLDFFYRAESDEAVWAEAASLSISAKAQKNILNELREKYESELDKLEKKVGDIRYSISKSEGKDLDFSEVNILLRLSEEKIDETRKDLKRDKFDEADDNILKIKGYLADAEEKLAKLGVLVTEKPPVNLFSYLFWIVTWIFLGAVVFVGYLLYRKISLLALLNSKGGEKKETEKKKEQEDDEFHKKLERLEKNLETEKKASEEAAGHDHKLILITLIFALMVSFAYFGNTGGKITAFAVFEAENQEKEGIVISEEKYMSGILEFSVRLGDISKYGSMMVAGFSPDGGIDKSSRAVFYIDSDLMKAFVSDGSSIEWCRPMLGYDWSKEHVFSIKVDSDTVFYIDGVEVCSIKRHPGKGLPAAVNKDGAKGVVPEFQYVRISDV